MTTPVICFDFDGTLVNHRGYIHPVDREILVSERRAVFVPATARLLPSVRRAFERNDMFLDRPIPFPLVLQNGAALYGPGETLRARYPFPPQTQHALIEIMESYPQATFWLYTLGGVYTLWDTPETMVAARRFDLELTPFSFSEAARAERYTKGVCLAENLDRLEGFTAQAAGLELELSCSLDAVLEINRAGVNKGWGLRTLLEALGQGEAQVFAAGDGENDLPLLKQAVLSFAPDTSPPAVCEQVDQVVNVSEGGLLTPILRAIGLR